MSERFLASETEPPGSSAPRAAEAAFPRESVSNSTGKQQKLDGDGMERKFMALVCDQQTSYDVEKWIARIFHMDTAGSVKQLRQLGGLELDEVATRKKDITGPQRDDAALKTKPFDAKEKRLVQNHIAKRVEELLKEVEAEFTNRLPIPPSPKEDDPGICDSGKPSICRNLDTVKLRLGHLKREYFKKRLRNDMLLYVEEAEKLVLDLRWESQKSTSRVAPTSKEDRQQTGPRQLPKKQAPQANSRLLKSVDLSIGVSKLSTVYHYMNCRYQLENSRSAKRIAEERTKGADVGTLFDRILHAEEDRAAAEKILKMANEEITHLATTEEKELTTEDQTTEDEKDISEAAATESAGK